MPVDTTLDVSDGGRCYTLTWDGLLAYHGGGAVAGAALGFRAVQAAATVLAVDGVVHRDSLSVVSGHPGPGYIDAFEYTTRCVTRQRLHMDTGLKGGRHSPYHDYAFEFLFSDSRRQREVRVTLRAGVLPGRFFDVLHARHEEADLSLDEELEHLKQSIADDAMTVHAPDLYVITTLRRLS